MNVYIARLTHFYYSKEIKKFDHLLTKGICLRQHYVEKINFLSQKIKYFSIGPEYFKTHSYIIFEYLLHFSYGIPRVTSSDLSWYVGIISDNHNQTCLETTNFNLHWIRSQLFNTIMKMFLPSTKCLFFFLNKKWNVFFHKSP